MPLGAPEQAIADELIALYREAQNNLQRELASALFAPTPQRAARLRALASTANEIRTTLENGTRSWLTTQLPILHQAGAQVAASQIGTAFTWTQPHTEAVQALATRTWSDVAANLRGLEDSTRTALRDLARDASRETLLEGRTAAQAGRDLEAWMGRRGIAAVTYANGAQHLAGDYADTLARTTTATAYNGGTITQLRGDDIAWVEVSDGPDCGWSDHGDPDKANGTIRTLEDAEAHSISHPRCARSFAGRPDITSHAEAQQARQFTPDEQAQMAAEERLRAATAPETLSGRSRQPRTARTARTPRTARGSAPAAGASRGSGGTPVSAAVNIVARGAAKDARTALAAIDKVHDDGVLPAVRLDGKTGRTAAGEFRHGPHVNEIGIDASSSWPALTTVHEVGHLLDRRAFPGDGFTAETALEVDNILHDWSTAVRASVAHLSIAGTAGAPGTVEYLLRPREEWARSYAQFIAQRSEDPTLRADLARALAQQARSGTTLLRQWEPDDFKPIAAAIEKVLAGLGWLL